MPTPSKFTEATRKRILDAKRIGASNPTAAAWAGIDAETLAPLAGRGKDASEGTAKRDFPRHVPPGGGRAEPKSPRGPDDRDGRQPEPGPEVP